MSDFAAKAGSPVHRRGLLQRVLFFVLVVCPWVAGSAAAVWFCFSQRRPFLLVSALIGVGVCSLLVDHFAYHTFCQIGVVPEGLVYRGGGVFWKRRRRTKQFPWQDYAYEAKLAKDSYVSLFVTDRKAYDAALGQGYLEQPFPALSLYPHLSAMNDFHLFVAEVRKYNPDVKLEYIHGPSAHWGRP